MKEMDPYRVPWFSDVAPSLLTNRTVRNYLNGFSEQSWPHVVKLTLLYGIVSLQQQYPGETFSLQQLKQAVQSAATNLVVQRNVPQLQRQLLNLQTDLDKVFDRLTVEPLGASDTAAHAADQRPPGPSAAADTVSHGSPARPQQREGRAVQIDEPAEFAPAIARQRSRGRRLANPAVTAPKPSGAWRAGEPSGYTSPPRTHPLRRSEDNQGATNPIYPDWWLTEPPQQPVGVPQQQQQQRARQQPRLAYSLPQQSQHQCVTDNDLVTPEYLVVSSSGYGQELPAPSIPGQGPPIMVTEITPHSIATARQQPQPQPQQCKHQHGGHPAPACRSLPAGPARRPAVRQVQSKIKQAIAASRQQAATRMQRREHLLATAVASSSLGGSLQHHGQQGTAGVDGVFCPPAAAAEQFISNPWTSWFVPGAGAATDISPGALADAEEEAGQQHQIGDSTSSSSSSPSRPSTAELTAAADVSCQSMPALQAATDVLIEDVLQDITFSISALNQATRASSSKGSSGHSQLSQQSAEREYQPSGVVRHRLDYSQQENRVHGSPSSKQASKAAWACDFGHLDVPELEAAAVTSAAASSKRPVGVKPRQLWSEKWVGNFGHLQGPRFTSTTAFNHPERQQPATGGMGTSGASSCDSGSPGLFMSPEQLQQMVDAAAEMPALGSTAKADNSTQQRVGATTDLQEPELQGSASEATAALGAEQHATLPAGVAGRAEVSLASASDTTNETWSRALLLSTQLDDFKAADVAAVIGGDDDGSAVSSDAGSESGLVEDPASALDDIPQLLQQAIARHGNVMQLIAGMSGLDQSQEE